MHLPRKLKKLLVRSCPTNPRWSPSRDGIWRPRDLKETVKSGLMMNLFFAWKDDPKNYEKYLEELKAERVSKWFSHLAESSDVKALPNGLSLLLKKMHPSKREQVMDGLRQLLG
uniref:Uncharacterized protein n=1 Tax=Arundo donax TaxID=35708 RepID=A0A0A9DC17_ARUDO